MMQQHIRMLSILLVIGLALFTWWRLRPERRAFFKVLGALMVTAFIVESIGYYTTIKQVNNADMYNAYTVLESWAVLYLVFLTNRKWKALLISVALLCVALMFSAYKTLSETGVFLHTEAILAIFLLLTLVCFAALISMAFRSEILIFKTPEFWVFMGFLVYFGGAAPILAVMRHLNEHDLELINQLRLIILPSICAVRYLMTAFGCTLELRKAR